jgi:ribosome-binding factor A
MKTKDENSLGKNRISSDIQRLLSEIIRTKLSDPIFSEFITIKSVNYNGSIVFVNFNLGFDDSEETKNKELKAKKAFDKEAGYISGLLARSLRLRKAPEMRFEIDTLSSFERKMDEEFAKL